MKLTYPFYLSPITFFSISIYQLSTDEKNPEIRMYIIVSSQGNGFCIAPSSKTGRGSYILDVVCDDGCICSFI